MKINFDNIQKNAMNEAAGSMADGIKAYGKMAGASDIRGAVKGGSGFAVDFSRKAEGIGGYSRQKDGIADALEDVGKDSSAAQDKMLLCASTMSGEDYKRMVEEGVDPAKTEVSDTVTIMDHIKEVMARSGVVVDGFNGEGDLDMDKLTQITGSPALAGQIADSFKENDLPLSEETAIEIKDKLDNLSGIDTISDGMKQYLLERNMAPTVDNLYLARFSASDAALSTGTYFADDQSGYIGRTGQLSENDLEGMKSSIEKVIEQADLSDDPRGYDRCIFLMDAGIPLTKENLQRLSDIEDITLPVDSAKAASLMADAAAQGKAPGQADLSGRDLYTSAKRIYDETFGITDEAVEQTLSQGKTFTIKELGSMQRQIDMGVFAADDNRQASAAASSETLLPDKLLSAQKTFAQVRLSMTVSANMALLSSGYSIDTTELTELVDRLTALENERNLTWGLQAPDKEKAQIFEQTLTERNELYSMPAALVGKIGLAQDVISFHQVHEQGRILEGDLKAAGQSYEALMTAPRADLGDSLKKAFSNTDDILKDLGFETTQDNQRAVRILVYNHMDINEENICSVRNTDLTLRTLLEKMNPAATLQMIRDGVNPLESTIDELSDYFDRQELSAAESSEKFAQFLYKLEQSDSITEDERDAYMGIYRMLHQIEKGDDSAIGWVVNNNRELTFENLLTGVRSLKKGSISQSIGEDTPLKGSKLK
ncbi:MAG: hypothetical protein J5842_06550, partial [Lachnospiraceae bacterium]|nr:hypothetical protein [Lachnospiraceae bacterium]